MQKSYYYDSLMYSGVLLINGNCDLLFYYFLLLHCSIGQLDAVTNLTNQSLGQVIHLTWNAPFSLDISGVDPDIWYRVDITVGNTLFNTYFVNIPELNFMMDNKTTTSVIYEFRVTPINGAGNGTTSAPVTGYFSGGELSV